MLIVIPVQAASLPLSIIIVGVGPAEFDGECSIIRFFFFMLVCINMIAECWQERTIYRGQMFDQCCE